MSSITKAKSGVKTVKMIIPFSFDCNTCTRRTDKGHRFPAIKEEIGKDSSLDVEIYRFKLTCPSCRANYSIVTDPGRYDYVLEGGATLVARKF